MSWAKDEWKDGMSFVALQKVDKMEKRIEILSKEVQQRDCKFQSLEAVLENQKKKTEEQKSLNTMSKRDFQDLSEQFGKLNKNYDKALHEIQAKDSRIDCLKVQVDRLNQVEKKEATNKTPKPKPDTVPEKVFEPTPVKSKGVGDLMCFGAEVPLKDPILAPSSAKSAAQVDLLSWSSPLPPQKTQSKLPESDKEIKELRNELTRKSSVLDAANAKIEDLQAQLTSLGDQVMGQSKEMTSSKSQLNKANDLSNNYSEKATFYEGRVKELQKELECQRHNAEAARNSVDAKMKTKESELREKERENQDLTRMMQKLEQLQEEHHKKLDATRQNLSLKTHEVESLIVKLETNEKLMSDRKKNVEQMEQKSLSLEHKLDLSEDKRNSAGKELKSAMDDLKNISNELHRMKNEMAASTNEKEKYKEKFDLASNSIRVHEEKFKDLESKSKSIERDNSDLSQQIQTALGKIKELDKVKIALTEDLSNLKNALQNKNNEFLDLQKSSTDSKREYEHTISEMKSEINELNQQAKVHTEKAGCMDVVMAEHKTLVEELNGKADLLEKEKKEICAKHSEMEEILQQKDVALKNAVDDLKNRDLALKDKENESQTMCKELSDNFSNLKSNYDVVQFSRDQLEIEMKTITEKYGVMEQKLCQVEANLVISEEDMEELHCMNAKLIEDNQNYIKQNENLSSENKSFETNNNALDSENEKLKLQLSIAKNDISQKDHSLSHLEGKKDFLTRNCLELSQALEESLASNNELMFVQDEAMEKAEQYKCNAEKKIEEFEILLQDKSDEILMTQQEIGETKLKTEAQIDNLKTIAENAKFEVHELSVEKDEICIQLNELQSKFDVLDSERFKETEELTVRLANVQVLLDNEKETSRIASEKLQEKIFLYEKAISDFNSANEELTELKETKENMDIDLNVVTKKCQCLESSIENSQQSMKEMNIMLELKEETVQCLMLEKNELESKRNAMIAKHRHDTNLLENELTETKQNLECEQDKSVSLRFKINELDGDLTSKDDELNEIKEQLQYMTQSNQEVKDNLNNRITSLGNEIVEKQSQIEQISFEMMENTLTYESTLETQKQELKSVHKDVDVLKSELTSNLEYHGLEIKSLKESYDNDIALLTQSKSDMEDEIESLSTRGYNQDEKIENYEKISVKQQDKLFALQTQLDDANENILQINIIQKAKEDLEVVTQNLTQEVDQLMSRKLELETDNSDLMTTKESLNSQVTSLENEAAENDLNMNNLNQEIENLKQQLFSVEERESGEIMNLKDELLDNQSKFSEFEEQVKILKGITASLEDEKSETGSMLQVKQCELDQLMSRRLELETDNSDLMTTKESLSGKVTSLENEAAENDLNMNNLNQEIENLKQQLFSVEERESGDIMKLKDELLDNQSKFSEFEEQVKILKGITATLEDEKSETASMLQVKQCELDQLMSYKLELETDNSDLMATKESLKSKVTSLENEAIKHELNMNNLNQEIDNVKQQLFSVEKHESEEIMKLKDELLDNQSKIGEFDEQVKVLKGVTSALEDKKSETESMLKVKQCELDQLMLQKLEIEANNSDLMTTKEILNSKVTSLESEALEHELNMNRLNQEVENLKQQLFSVEKRESEEIMKLKDELLENQSKNEDFVIKVNELVEQIRVLKIVTANLENKNNSTESVLQVKQCELDQSMSYQLELETCNSNLLTTKQNLNNKVTTLENEAIEHKLNITNLNQEIENLKQQLFSVEERESEDVMKLKDELLENQSKNEEFVVKLREFEEQVKVLKEVTATLKYEKSETESMLEVKQCELDQLMLHKLELEANTSDLMTAKETLNSKVTSLESEALEHILNMTNLNQEIENLKQQLFSVKECENEEIIKMKNELLENKSKIDEFDEQIIVLKEVTATLKDEKSETASMLQTKQCELNQLMSYQLELETCNSNLLTTKQNLNSKVITLENEIIAHELNMNNLNPEIENLKQQLFSAEEHKSEEVMKLKDELLENQSKFSEFEDEVKVLKGVISTLEDEKNETKSMLQVKQCELDQLMLHKLELEANTSDLMTAKETLNSRVTSLENEAAENELNMNNLNQEIENLKLQLSSVDKHECEEIIKLKDELLETKSKIDEFDEQVKVLKGVTSTLEDEKSENESMLQVKQCELDQLMSYKLELEADKSDLITTKESLNSKITSLENEAAENDLNMNNLNQEIENLKQQLFSMEGRESEEMIKLKDELLENKSKISEFEDQVKVLEGVTATLEDEKSETGSMLQVKQCELDQLMLHKLELEDNISDLMTTKDSLNSKITSLENEAIEHELNMNNLNQEVDNIKQQLFSMEGRESQEMIKLKDELLENQLKNKEFVDKLGEFEENVKVLKRVTATLEDEKSETESILQVKQCKLDQLMSYKLELETDNSDLMTTKESLNSQVTSLENEAAENDLNMNNLNQEIENLKQQLFSVKGRESEEIMKLKDELLEKQSKNEDFVVQLSEFEEKVKVLKGRTATMEYEKIETESMLEVKQCELDQLMSRKLELETDNLNLLATKESLNSKVTSLENEAAENDLNMNNLNQEIENLKQQLLSVEERESGEIMKLKDELLENQSKLSEFEEQVKVLKGKTATLEDEKNELQIKQCKLDQLMSLKLGLETDNSDLMTTKESLNSQITYLENEAAENDLNMNNLNQEIENLKQQLFSVEERESGEIMKLKDELLENQSKLSEFEEQVKVLKVKTATLEDEKGEADSTFQVKQCEELKTENRCLRVKIEALKIQIGKNEIEAHKSNKRFEEERVRLIEASETYVKSKTSDKKGGVHHENIMGKLMDKAFPSNFSPRKIDPVARRTRRATRTVSMSKPSPSRQPLSPVKLTGYQRRADTTLNQNPRTNNLFYSPPSNEENENTEQHEKYEGRSTLKGPRTRSKVRTLLSPHSVTDMGSPAKRSNGEHMNSNSRGRLTRHQSTAVSKEQHDQAENCKVQ